MLISSKKALLFRQEVIQEQDGTRLATTLATFRLPASLEPVSAPDWVKETLLFTLALQDGSLTVYSGAA